MSHLTREPKGDDMLMLSKKEEKLAAKLALRAIADVRANASRGVRRLQTYQGADRGMTAAVMRFAGNLDVGVVAVAEAWAASVLAGELAEAKLTEWAA
jgi:hypothetical protein